MKVAESMSKEWMIHRATFLRATERKAGLGYARQGYVFHDGLLSSVDSASSLEQIAAGLKTKRAAPAGASSTATRFSRIMAV
jgi:hypothetical protein